MEQITSIFTKHVYLGDDNLTVRIGEAGTYQFFGCSGEVNVAVENAKVFATDCPDLKIIRTVNAKTYRNGIELNGLYLTSSAENPADRVGGVWEKLTSDAYLKIVTQNAGTTGGTSENHKIPVDSLPQHKSAAYFNGGTFAGYGFCLNGGSTRPNMVGCSAYEINKIGAAGELLIDNGGKDLPYYPYFYGVYVWKRIHSDGQE